MTLVPLPTLVFPIPSPLFWQEQIDHPEKLEPIRFSLPHPFDLTAHAKSAPTSRLPTIASIAANRWWENHIAGACPPKYNLFSRRREFRSMFFADLRADVRVPVWVWEEEVQSQPIVRLSAHVSYSYFHFTLADHVFEIACNQGSSNNNLASLILRGIKLSSPAGFAANLLWNAFGDEIVAGASWFAENVFPVLNDATLHIWNGLKFVFEFSPIGLIKDSFSALKETWFPEEDPRPHGTLADVKHISDSEYLAAAEMAYEPSNPDPKRADFRKLMQEVLDGEGWKEVNDIDVKVSKINGFGGKVFVNEKKKTVMIAFRGTEPPDHRG